MSKQQKNRAFVKMLKEFPKEFGRVSFRERLMLRTAFDYINEEVIADIKANCDLAIEGRDVKIKELEEENNKLLDVINGQDVKIADLEKENAELKSEKGCEICTKFDEVKLTKAKEIILKLYNAGRDVLMCRAEEKAYDNLETAINDRSIEQFIKEIEK